MTNLENSAYPLLVAKKRAEAAAKRAEASVPESVCPIQTEFLDYMSLGDDHAATEHIKFWRDYAARFPLLSKLAFTLIVVQASSGESERMFSIAGWHTIGRKNRLEKKHLTQKVF